jgi:hypothetical protein
MIISWRVLRAGERHPHAATGELAQDVDLVCRLKTRGNDFDIDVALRAAAVHRRTPVSAYFVVVVDAA